jgi:hypothetical protein
LGGRTPFSDLIFSNNDGVKSGAETSKEATPVDKLKDHVDLDTNSGSKLNSTSTGKATSTLTKTATVQESTTRTTNKEKSNVAPTKSSQAQSENAAQHKTRTTTLIKDVAPTKGSVVQSENAAEDFDSFTKEYMKEFNIAPNGDVYPTSQNPMYDVQGTLDPIEATGNDADLTSQAATVEFDQDCMDESNPDYSEGLIGEDGNVSQDIFRSSASNTMALGFLLSFLAYLI